ncbi:MAG: 50S ribosomal protein L3 [Deltaproteobacteria bacterium]|nr:50S ribosomal protein L3 [Deltaproteobacteria bacterium]
MLVGRKIGMSQMFDERGERIVVTLIAAQPCKVTEVRTPEREGYRAIQVGYDEKEKDQIAKPQQKRCEKIGGPYFKRFVEFRVLTSDKVLPEVGASLSVEQFKSGDSVDMIGTSKGKGFAGVIKRHHFAGGPASHGSMFYRAPGSIGSNTFPGRVIKGKKLPGHMGSKRITVKHLKVVQVDPKENLLVVSGAVPGGRNGWVVVRHADQGIKC